MRLLLLPCLAVCSLALSGCGIVYSAHPLTTGEDATEEPALEGNWAPTAEDDGNEQLCIRKFEGNGYVMAVSKPNSKLVEFYNISLVRLNDQLYADMSAASQEFDRTEVGPLAGTIAHHVILRVDVTDNDLTYFGIDPDAVDQQNKDGYPPLEFVKTDDAMLLTTSTEDLRQYISDYGDRIFKKAGGYTRKVDDDIAGGGNAPCRLPGTPPT